MPRLMLKIASFLILITLAIAFSPNITYGAGTKGIEAQELYPFEPADCSLFIDSSKVPFFSLALEERAYRCGFVSVPERHDNPKGKMIQLPVAILPASDSNPSPDPLFVVQGGPGGSAFEIFPYLLSYSPLAKARDIVIINQRGTQHANPELICHEIFDGIAEAALLPADEALKLALEQIDTCKQRLVSQGVDLSAYNSLENAADIEAVRQSLGYDEYNFYGVSYGTLLGLHLLREYPEHLRSVILDGVLPPQVSFIAEVPINQQRVFNELFQSCLTDEQCSQDYPNLEERLINIIDQLNDDPETVNLRDSETGAIVQARLDGDILLDLLYQSIYLDHPYAIFPRIITDIEAGKYLFIEQLWSLVTFDRSFSEGMYFSTICSEEIGNDLLKNEIKNLKPYITNYLEEELQSYLDFCKVWEVSTVPMFMNQAVESEKPVLLLSGQFDPITPPEFADLVHASLPNSYNIVDPYGSHGVAFDNECVNGITEDFLDNPTEAPDSTCLYSEDRRNAVVPKDAVSAPFLGPFSQLESRFMTGIGLATLLLIFILSCLLIWPLVWLIDLVGNKKPILDPSQKWVRLLGRIVVIAYGLLALLFAISMLVYVIFVLSSNLNYLSVYVLPSSATLFLLIPYILIMLNLGMLMFAIYQWRNKMGRLWERLYYSSLTICGMGFLALLSIQGFLFFNPF